MRSHQIDSVGQARTLPVAIAWISLYLLALSWTPFVPVSVKSIWGYAGLFGLTASLGLTSRAIRTLRRQALVDSLTGLWGRKFAEQFLKHELAVATRCRKKLSVIFADIDHFKKLNDRYGHAAGDCMLKHAARIIEDSFRSSDTVARFGGDEFVMILPQTDSDGANILAERLRAAIESQAIDLPGRSIRVTMSFGIATLPDDASSAEELLQRADESLYMAKQSGRNASAMFKDSWSRMTKADASIPHSVGSSLAGD